MWEGLLPVGSIVILKGTEQKIMVAGVCQIVRETEEDVMYDYSGVLHPYGFVDSEQIYLFDRDDIATVVSIGYMDDEQFRTFGILEDLNRKVRDGKMTIDEALQIEWPEPEVLPPEDEPV